MRTGFPPWLRAVFSLAPLLAAAASGAAEGTLNPASLQLFESRPKFDHVCLSPDGHYVAYAEQGAVSVIDVPALTGSRLVFRSPGAVTFLGWAAGKLIIEDTNQFIYYANPDGSGRGQLTDPYSLALKPASHWTGAFESARADSEQDLAEARSDAANATSDDARFDATVGTSARVPGGSSATAGAHQRAASVGARLSTLDRGMDIGIEFPPGDRDQPPGSVARPPAILSCEATSGDVVVLAKGDEGRYDVPTDVLRFNAVTGQKQLLLRLNYTPQAVLVDAQGRPRIALRRRGHTSAADYVSLSSDSITRQVCSPLNRGNRFGERAIPLAFSARGDRLYFASNLDRDTYGIYAWDLTAHAAAKVRMEDPGIDLIDPASAFPNAGLLFDPTTHELAGVRVLATEWLTRWLDPALGRAQAALNRLLPHRTVRIQGWNQDRTRFLVLADGPSRPPRCYVYLSQEDRLIQCLRSGPSLDADLLSPTTSFSIPADAGDHLTGFLTEARQPKLSPPPLVVVLHDGPFSREAPDFNLEAQQLAQMGFAVARVNYHGSVGFGRRFRSEILRRWDRIPLADVDTIVQWLAGDRRIDARRVAVIGHGFGGFLAYRAQQASPGHYAAVVAIADSRAIERWLQPPPTNVPAVYPANPVRGQPGADLYDYRHNRAASPFSSFELTSNQDLFHSASSLLRTVAEVRDSPTEADHLLVLHSGGSGLGIAELTRLQEFLNLNLYDPHLQVAVPVPKD